MNPFFFLMLSPSGREKLKCCACNNSMGNSKLNIMCLMKEAKWAHPSWGNVILGIEGLATAIICDDCLKNNKKPKYAIEWDARDPVNTIQYHPVKDLVDVPKEIFEQLDEVEPGRRGIAG